MICNNQLLSMLDEHSMTPYDLFGGLFDEDFSWKKTENKIKKYFDEKETNEGFDDWKSTIREASDKMSVAVPYDSNKETLVVETTTNKDNTHSFNVKVEYNDGLNRKSYSRTVYIPEDYSIKYNSSYDEKNKVMTFEFKKKEEKKKVEEETNSNNKIKEDISPNNSLNKNAEKGTATDRLQEAIDKVIADYTKEHPEIVSVKRYKPIYGKKKHSYLIEF